MNLRKRTATLGVAAVVAAPLGLLTAAPASATEKEFNVAGAQASFEVEREDRGFKVDVDLDHAQAGSRWRVTLWHDGKRFFRDVRRANGDGEIREILRNRPDTRGKDVFKVRIKRLGGDSAVRRIRKR